MPRSIRDVEQFQKLTANAHECRVVRSASGVKLKLRTPEYLYTYSTNEDEAEDLLKSLKDVKIIELSVASNEKGEKKE
ncbi:MAG: hypothetical protein ACRECH_00255 [Nitrososphaerales archaeon]